jgi:hypothetical protein
MFKLKQFIAGAVVALVGCVGLSAPASAAAAFDFNLVFADGGTATGTGTVVPAAQVNPASPNNFVGNVWGVTSTGANGYHYANGLGQPTPQFADGNLYLTFTRSGSGFLQLEFTAPFNGNGSYSLVLAGSFECIGGFQSGTITQNICSHGTIRGLNGDATQTVSVPEPGSLALFGTALFLFAGFVRWRKNTPKN